MTEGNSHRDTTDRAREPWIATPAEDRYAAGMRMSGDARRARAAIAARAAAGLARQLAERQAVPVIPGETRWPLRGGGAFGQPRPGGFAGGLPAPGEYPEVSRLVSRAACTHTGTRIT